MRSKKSRIIFWVVVGVSVAILLAILFSQLLSVQYTKVSITPKFVSLINEGKINRISVDGYVMKGVLYENGKVVNNVGYETVYGSLYSSSGIHDFQQWLISLGMDPAKAQSIEFVMEDPNAGSVWSSVFTIASIVIVALIFWLIMRSAAGGGAKTMNIGKTKAHVQSNLKVRFADVAGAEEEKEELQEVVEFLKQPRKFSDLGARIPRGVLLVGPPGTGKTLFAKAVAGEAGVPFFSVSGSDFVEMYVGVGASRVRDLFDMAKKNQPCIIFIDEIDAVGRRRGAGLGGGHDEREQTLNQILVQMDGFETNEGIIVMAATNRADILDPALLRPGRFDRQINVNLPDVKGREQILKVHARNKPIAPEVNFKTVARMTVGFSGADLANLLNEAAILTARANKKLIGNVELYESIDKVLMGLKKKSHVVTEADKRITAYHEAGHAVLAGLCKNCDPVHEVTVVPRGNGAGGFTMTRPDEDTSYYSYNKLVDDICMSLGGRAAEELVIKDITTGASADLQHVSDRARRMVKQWGMSEKLGLVAYDNDQPVFVGMEYEYGGASRNSYSQETAAEIDREVRDLIHSAYERAKKLLSENRSILDNMSRVLVERETIYAEEVEMLMRGASYTEVLAFMDSEESGARKDNPFARFEEKKPAAEAPAEETPVTEAPAEEMPAAQDSDENKE